MRTPIDQKIALLLAKAESTTPEEAEALTEAAEKLMVRHGITQAMIDARRATSSEPEEIVVQTLRFTGDHCRGMHDMAVEVAFAFGTVRLMSSGRARAWQRLDIIGYESDVEQINLLITSLQLQAAVAMRSWLKGDRRHQSLTQAERRRAKHSFLLGFGLGARERISRATQEVVSETPGSELALRDRKSVVDEWVDGFYGKVGKRNPSTGLGYGIDDGRSAGAQANTGDRAIGGHRALT